MNIKNIQLSKAATAFLLAIVLFVTTACNSGDELGARPNNSPVQMGGQNNPHKVSGDGMTQYRSPANDALLEKGQSSLPFAGYLAAANNSETSYPTDDNGLEGLLYSDDKAESLKSVDEFVNPRKQQELLDPTKIPAEKQPAIDRSNPDNKLLEKVGQMFDDAADFSAN